MITSQLCCISSPTRDTQAGAPAVAVGADHARPAGGPSSAARLDTIGLVQQFADEGLAVATQYYLTEQLGDRGRAALKSKWRTSNCDSLATAADRCGRFRKKFVTASGLDDSKYMEGVSVPVRQFNPVEAHASQAAALLRATGDR